MIVNILFTMMHMLEKYKVILGLIAAIVQGCSYLFYFLGIYKGTTKPHAFTWFVRGVINVIAFLAVVTSDAGAGAWIFAINMFSCLTVALIGFRQKYVDYDVYDWYALCGGIFGGILWWLTSDPLYAVIFVCLSDGIAMIPTIRKAYTKPFEENALSFVISVFGFGLSIFAIDSFSITTLLYPIIIVSLDAFLVGLLLVRRKIAKN